MSLLFGSASRYSHIFCGQSSRFFNPAGSGLCFFGKLDPRCAFCKNRGLNNLTKLLLLAALTPTLSRGERELDLIPFSPREKG